MARTDLPWLVRSSGRILGPYPTEKVEDLLRSRDVSMLDEISRPGRRYQTIQYIEEFRDVIEGLRKSSLSERTEAAWSSHTNLTQTLTDLESGTMTAELTESGFTAGPTKEIVVDDLEETPTASANAGGQGRFQSAQAQNTAIARQVDKTTRGLWIVTGLVLLLAAGFIWRKRVVTPVEQKAIVGGFRQNVLNMIQVGHYADALRELKGAFADPNQAGDMGLYFGSLLVQVEGQTSLGRRLFQGVLAARRPEAKQAYTGLGVADLIDGQVDQAADSLERALALDGDYTPAILNLANVHLKRGNYDKAKELAQRALRTNPKQGEALLTLAEAQSYLSKANPTADLVPVARQIKDYLAKQWDWSSELGLYDILFDHLRREPTINEHLRQYLDRDPELTTDHRHNVFVYRGRFQWSVLARLCEQLAPRLGSTAHVATLQASCYAHEGRWDAARTSIERAVHQDPKDPLVQAWYSYVLRESGDKDRSSVVLGHATDLDRRGEYVLPALLQARFCQRAQIADCTRTWWQKLYEHDLEFLPALGGLALFHWSTNAKTEAVGMIQKGLKISPDYIPLLELRQKAEADGSLNTSN